MHLPAQKISRSCVKNVLALRNSSSYVFIFIVGLHHNSCMILFFCVFACITGILHDLFLKYFDPSVDLIRAVGLQLFC